MEPTTIYIAAFLVGLSFVVCQTAADYLRSWFYSNRGPIAISPDVPRLQSGS